MRLLGVALFILLTGCARYEALSLRDFQHLPQDVREIAVDSSAMSWPPLTRHAFDPRDGLDMIEVAMLAVANNQSLKLARDDLGIARAQAFSAGLLPDPEVSLAHDVNGHHASGLVMAYSMGLSYDIGALVLRSANRAAARGEADQVNLNLLWQEAQVASEAQLLFVRLFQGQRLQGVLEETLQLAAEQLSRTQQALIQGLIGADAVTVNWTNWQATQSQLFDLRRKINQDRHALNTLLGLPAETRVPLQGEARTPALDESAVRAALERLPRRRADLLALEAGYRAQDERYRGALLRQFPALQLGFSNSRDTDGVYSDSIGLNLTIPIFNRNRGQIAIEKATRKRLYDEYHQRLLSSRNEIDLAVTEQRLNEHQLEQIERTLESLRKSLAQSATAYRAGLIDLSAYAAVHFALLNKQAERIATQQAILEQRIELQTLLGGTLPAVPAS